METQVPSPKARLRVSLFGLLVLTAFAALGVTTLMLWRELGPLRAEVKRLRSEAGEITISDRSKPHAIEVDTDHPKRWKWVVWIPNGQRHRLRVAIDQITATGLPTSSRSLGVLEPGEHVVTFRLDLEETRDSWIATTRTATAIKASRVGWGESLWYTERGVARETRAFDPNREAILFRYQASDVSNPSKIAGPTDGCLIWLEPEPS